MDNNVPAPPDPRPAKQPPAQRSATLPDLLRKGGALAVLTALYSFLSRGWDGGDDLAKYLMLLASTGALAALALAIGHTLKEGRSPRLLLVLALVSVPINFAILGAFILSASSDPLAVSFPAFLAWSVADLSTALLTTAAASIVLLPVTTLAYRVLARGMSQRLSVFFLLSNTLLLIPLRDPRLITALAVAMGMLTLLITARTARQRIEVRTPEGRLALLLQFLPLGILIGRNLWLYATEELVLLAASTSCYIALRQLAFLIGPGSWIRPLLKALSVIAALATALLTAVVADTLQLKPGTTLLLGTLVASGLVYEISLRDAAGSAVYRSLAMLIIVAGCIVNVVLFPGLLASVTTLCAGVALLLLGYALELRSLLFAGVMLSAIGLIDQGIHLFQWFDPGYWIVLLVLGVVAIVLASLLDARGGWLKAIVRQHRRQFSQWSY
jgi:hypothetical protein